MAAVKNEKRSRRREDGLGALMLDFGWLPVDHIGEKCQQAWTRRFTGIETKVIFFRQKELCRQRFTRTYENLAMRRSYRLVNI
jgi:hypothetical protein